MSSLRPRLSIRVKILALTTTLLLASVGCYLFLAVRIFREDKLAYVYDLNAAMVETLSRESEAALDLLRSQLSDLAEVLERSASTPDQQSAQAARFFAAEPDALRIQLFERNAQGRLDLRGNFENPASLADLGLTRERLASLRGPPDAALKSGFQVFNVSAPPDAAVLSLQLAPGGKGADVVVLDFRQTRFLKLFERLKSHEAFLVSQDGTVLAHPSAERVVSRTRLADEPLVAAALAQTAQQGAKEYAADGKGWLGAWSSLRKGGLHVCARVDREKVLAASSELVRRSTFFGVAILGAAFAACIGFARLLTAPIRDLSRAVQRLSAGEFDIDVRVRSRDEIGQFSEEFARMATALKEAQVQMVRSARLAAFGQLGAGITHEVKNPVGGILSLAQLAKGKLNDPAKLAELIDVIESEARRCTDILMRLLGFARASGPEHVVLSPADLLAEVSKLLKHQLSVHDVKLEVRVADDAPSFRATRGDMIQVLLNLALNAQHAMPKGGRVVLAASRAPSGELLLTVDDTGPGVPQELRSKIFEAFFTTKGPDQGTGLGLSVCRTVVRDLRGDVSVEDAPGGGARFVIRLPPDAPGSHHHAA